MADTAADETVQGVANRDPLWGDWDTPPRVSGIPELRLDGFEGPMELLLELAERQRIDLRQISVQQLAEQFAAAMERLQRHVALERRADWLVLAARLLELRSRLLLPEEQAGAGKTAWDADREAVRLNRVVFTRAAATWLDRQSQLGRDVFARPQSLNPRVASYMALMEACLSVLHGRDEQPGVEEEIYRPPSPAFFRVAEAMARIRALVAESLEEAIAFSRCLPGVMADDPLSALKARSAVTSSFVAVLELARVGSVVATQKEQHGPIVLSGRV